MLRYRSDFLITDLTSDIVDILYPNISTILKVDLVLNNTIVNLYIVSENKLIIEFNIKTSKINKDDALPFNDSKIFLLYSKWIDHVFKGQTKYIEVFNPLKDKDEVISYINTFDEVIIKIPFKDLLYRSYLDTLPEEIFIIIVSNLENREFYKICKLYPETCGKENLWKNLFVKTYGKKLFDELLDIVNYVNSSEKIVEDKITWDDLFREFKSLDYINDLVNNQNYLVLYDLKHDKGEGKYVKIIALLKLKRLYPIMYSKLIYFYKKLNFDDITSLLLDFSLQVKNKLSFFNYILKGEIPDVKAYNSLEEYIIDIPDLNFPDPNDSYTSYKFYNILLRDLPLQFSKTFVFVDPTQTLTFFDRLRQMKMIYVYDESHESGPTMLIIYLKFRYKKKSDELSALINLLPSYSNVVYDIKKLNEGYF